MIISTFILVILLIHTRAYLRLNEFKMNLILIQPKNETEYLILSLTKNCGTPIEQTHRKAEETLKIKMTKPREKFHLNPPIQIKGDWMIGLTRLEVHNLVFNVTE